ncbi:MAG TPA: GNAT family N-acetyltransferase [Chthoniobacterales bacterium]|nr:GNAT family N-acetyltransferase [Chthoniobacterales bacterium]
MSDIEVTPVASARERDQFIKFPWHIYRGDPAWVPPLLLERKEFLDRKKHPFYEHGDAAIFLARRNGKIVGRIMASDDPNYNAVHRSNVGCFGLFETIEDRLVAQALFDAASDWLRARGRTEIIGPIDYSTNYVCGLLIDGFQHPPALLTSHNPPYYSALIESCGFRKAMDLYAWWFSDPGESLTRLRRLSEAMKKRHRVQIRPVNLKDFQNETKRIRSVYNQAWEKNWGYVPFTEREFEHLAKELKPIVVPETTLIAEIGGEPIGFIIGVPDINVALRHLNGRLTRFGLPIGLAKLLYLKNRIRTGRLVALGVVEKFRRYGIAEMMILKVIDYAVIKRGFSGELSLTLETNHMVNRLLETLGAKRYKTYRIYRREIAAASPAEI